MKDVDEVLPHIVGVDFVVTAESVSSPHLRWIRCDSEEFVVRESDSISKGFREPHSSHPRTAVAIRVVLFDHYYLVTRLMSDF